MQKQDQDKKDEDQQKQDQEKKDQQKEDQQKKDGEKKDQEEKDKDQKKSDDQKKSGDKKQDFQKQPAECRRIRSGRCVLRESPASWQQENQREQDRKNEGSRFKLWTGPGGRRTGDDDAAPTVLP